MPISHQFLKNPFKEFLESLIVSHNMGEVTSCVFGFNTKSRGATKFWFSMEYSDALELLDDIKNNILEDMEKSAR